MALSNAEKAKRWRLANPEKAKASKRKWELANREKTNAARRQWRKMNPQKDSEASKRWRLANYEAWHKIHLRRTQRVADRLNEFKKGPCTDCNVQYPPYVMDFDHVRGEKIFNVARMKGHSLEALKAEIAKCDLVCSNCHRERTQSRHARRFV
jgi:hypothetical protein